MEEAHTSVCRAHQSGPRLHDYVRRIGYYCLTMVHDCIDFAKSRDICQLHANFIHQPLEPLHPTIKSLPFKALGLDIVRPFTPKSSAWYTYILAPMNYFSKWGEVISLRKVNEENIDDFI